MRILPLFSLILLVGSGCTSYRSTIMQRNDDDTFSKNATASHTRGLPVKLKVPTHLEVTVTETFVVERVNDGNRSIYREIPILLDGNEIHAQNVQTRVIYTDKVFTVDFNRPAAGMLDLSNISFDDEQYFAKIRAEYTEQTLADISTAISTVRPLLARPSAAAAKADPNLAINQRVVAQTRFDIATPQWEELLQAFIAQHVTPMDRNRLAVTEPVRNQ
ncbi:MAG: hypothetical protein RIS70_4353 [Planctomycetota bacterium]|jgi:hypothetical protein